jgi:hypothetical protein
MQLIINNHPQTFIALQTFRTRWGLPDDFATACFEPKEWTGLGSVEGSGQALAAIKHRILDVVPAVVQVSNLIPVVDILSTTFRRELETANEQIGLRQVEIDFAVAGFHDLLQAIIYRLIHLVHMGQGDMVKVHSQFDFREIYLTWLSDSVRISTRVHTYVNGEQSFEVRIIYNAYGRIGLEVLAVDGQRYYVADMSLACPASGYMETLTEQVTQKLCEALH